ncbi:MAG TPA: SprB repeat-containing protein, partial [Candidatus Saccharimonadales bacterium]
FYSYNDGTNTWTAIASVPAAGRWLGVGFAVNNKGYVGTGQSSNGGLDDYWEYGFSSKMIVSDTTSVCGAGGDSVYFSDSTNYIAATWSWYFPGGSPTSSALKNPAVYYSVSGTNTVTLIFKSCEGIDTITRTITVTIGSSPTITTLVTANEKCNGDCAGSVSTTVTGGTSPYIYSWAPSGGSTGVATGLCAGIYTLTVTDRGGCTSTAMVSITQPATPITATTKATNAICNGGTGSVVVSPKGGVSPYTYLWTPSRQTTATATGLSAGNYTIQITDLNGCTATAKVNITQPAAITATETVNNVMCNGGKGSATVTPMAGVSPYTYLWTPSGQSTAMATGLNPGNYTIKITDINGCTASATLSITQPTLLTATISATNNVLCYGGVGSATVTAGGGTLPYTYLWAHSGGTNATGTGLTVGVYTITVSDHNGCSATAGTTITQPTALTMSTTTIHSYCNLPNGSATAIVGGGTSPYVYLWTPSAQTSATATGLGVGTYSITVTDKNHCTASATASITQPITTTAIITSAKNVSCNGSNDGAITVTASGGLNPYTYLWMPGGNTAATATSLFAVSYTVAVADANGCIATATATLTQPPVLTVIINEPQIICKDSTG